MSNAIRSKSAPPGSILAADDRREVAYMRLTTAGIVLVLRKPDSAKSVMFITIEDESGIANLVVWSSLYERQRPIILSASMIAVHNRVQREGELVHLVADKLTDISKELAGVGERNESFPSPHGRGDEFHHGSTGGDPRDLPPKACGHATSTSAISTSTASR